MLVFISELLLHFRFRKKGTFCDHGVDCLCLFAREIFRVSVGNEFPGAAISLVNSHFVFKVMLIDSSIDRNFWSVFRSFVGYFRKF